MDRRVFEIQQELANSHVLGIVGVGGIGETTLAKALFNNLFRRGDVKKAVVSNESGFVGKIEQYAYTAEKQSHLASLMVRTSLSFLSILTSTQLDDDKCVDHK